MSTPVLVIPGNPLFHPNPHPQACNCSVCVLPTMISEHPLKTHYYTAVTALHLDRVGALLGQKTAFHVLILSAHPTP